MIIRPESSKSVRDYITNNVSNIIYLYSVADVQPDIPYAHPQRAEALHMHDVSKGILPQFRSEEGKMSLM